MRGALAAATAPRASLPPLVPAGGVCGARRPDPAWEDARGRSAAHALVHLLMHLIFLGAGCAEPKLEEAAAGHERRRALAQPAPASLRLILRVKSRKSRTERCQLYLCSQQTDGSLTAGARQQRGGLCLTDTCCTCFAMRAAAGPFSRSAVPHRSTQHPVKSIGRPCGAHAGCRHGRRARAANQTRGANRSMIWAPVVLSLPQCLRSAAQPSQ